VGRDISQNVHQSLRGAIRRGDAANRVVGPTDVAALAVYIKTNTAVTGASYVIDGSQQLVEV
jgi:hypothetical protein